MINKEEFYQGLEKEIPRENYITKKRSLENSAFNKIFLDSETGAIKWERLNVESLKGEAHVQDYSGKLVTIPVFFNVVSDDRGSIYLSLFNAKGSPCKNQFDERVQRLRESLEWIKFLIYKIITI